MKMLKRKMYFDEPFELPGDYIKNFCALVVVLLVLWLFASSFGEAFDREMNFQDKIYKKQSFIPKFDFNKDGIYPLPDEIKIERRFYS